MIVIMLTHNHVLLLSLYLNFESILCPTSLCFRMQLQNLIVRIERLWGSLPVSTGRLHLQLVFGLVALLAAVGVCLLDVRSVCALCVPVCAS